MGSKNSSISLGTPNSGCNSWERSAPGNFPSKNKSQEIPKKQIHWKRVCDQKKNWKKFQVLAGELRFLMFSRFFGFFGKERFAAPGSHPQRALPPRVRLLPGESCWCQAGKCSKVTPWHGDSVTPRVFWNFSYFPHVFLVPWMTSIGIWYVTTSNSSRCKALLIIGILQDQEILAIAKSTRS